MKSLSLVEPGKFQFVEVPEPSREDGETLVKVLGCGVCGSDLHAISGKQPFFSYPRRLGHELCVEVIEVDPLSVLAVGDRCVIEPYYFCGECISCRNGKTNSCTNLNVFGIHFDGGHAPQISVKTKYLHLANELTVEQASLVEPLAIGYHAFNRARMTCDDKVVVLGMGTIGLATAMFAKSVGAKVAIVDIDNNRLDFAESTMKLGAAFSANKNLTPQLEAYFGQQPNVVVDATGNKQSMESCFDIVAYSGRIVFVGLFPGQVKFDPEVLYLKELDLLASRAALSDDFTTVISAIAAGTIDPLPLINNYLDFEHLDKQLPNLLAVEDLRKAVISYPQH